LRSASYVDNSFKICLQGNRACVVQAEEEVRNLQKQLAVSMPSSLLLVVVCWLLVVGLVVGSW